MSDSQQKFEEVYRIVAAGYRPEPFAVYKPKKSGDGVALKVNLRLTPTYGDTYVEDVQGGLFLDLVAQGPEKNGFPTFKWTEKATMVTAKLGMPDVSALLVAIREYRHRGVDVPASLRGKGRGDQPPAPNVVSLFHKHEVAGTTGITYTFGEESSVLRVSKSAQQVKSIALTLQEELVLERYLLAALDAFLKVGL